MTAKQIHIDPEFRDLIPPLTADEKSLLLASILRDGCRDPLVVWLNHGTLLDGHHRFEICEANGIEYETVEKHFPDKNAAMAWMIRNQFGRRNLTAMQRSELALKLKPLIEEKAKERQSAAGKSSAPGRPAKKDVQKSAQVSSEKTRDEVAKLAGVSHDTIAKAKVVLERATPEVVQKVRSGEMKINTAYRQIVNKPSGIQKTKDGRRHPFNPATVEKMFTAIRKAVAEMATTCELLESKDLSQMIKSIERTEKAFAKFSRRCSTVWRTMSVTPAEDNDEQF